MRQNWIKNPQLDGDSFYWKGNSIGIALSHGFTATTAEVRLLASHLHADGFTVAAPLLPGHGTHPDELNQTRWMAWFEAFEQTYLELRQSCERVFVGGESMGALLAMLVASRYHDVDGLMVFTPALRVKNLSGAYLLQYFKKYLEKNQPEDGLPWKGYDVYPLKGTVQLLKLQGVVRRELPQIDQPALIVMGGKDATVAPEVGDIIFKNIGSMQKQLVTLPESPHVLLLANEKEQAFQLADEFIRQVLQNKA